MTDALEELLRRNFDKVLNVAVEKDTVFRLGPLSVADVCAIGYPRWWCRVGNPRKRWGLFLEVATPSHHWEFRWSQRRQRVRAA